MDQVSDGAGSTDISPAERARLGAERGDWESVAAAFEQVGEVTGLEADDLELWATACCMLARTGDLVPIGSLGLGDDFPSSTRRLPQSDSATVLGDHHEISSDNPDAHDRMGDPSWKCLSCLSRHEVVGCGLPVRACRWWHRAQVACGEVWFGGISDSSSAWGDS